MPGTYVWLELSLHNLAGLLVNRSHGAVLVDFTTKFASYVGNNFGDRASASRNGNDRLGSLLHRVL